MGMEED